MGESLRRCDLQMGCSHTETHSFHMGRTWVPARSRFGEEVGRDGPISPLIPRMNEARPFSQEPPLRIARQGCPSLSWQLWQWRCSGPNCVCFPCFPPQGPLTLTEALGCCSATTLPMALLSNSSSHTVLLCPFRFRNLPLVFPPYPSSQTDLTVKVLKGVSLH